MKEAIFLVSGMKPYPSKECNELLAACDLGTTGAFIPFGERLTISFSVDLSDERIKKTIDNIKNAYTSLGCVDLKIKYEDSIKSIV